MAANTGVKQEHSSEKAEGLPSTLQQPLTLSSAPSLGKCQKTLASNEVQRKFQISYLQHRN